MTIEEKAYDKAIKKGKQILNTPYTAHWDIMKEVVEHLFPELKEIEDERIRKEIIKYFKKYQALSLGDYNVQDILAWLEKQGTTAEKDRGGYNLGFACGKQRVLKNPEDFGLCKKPEWSEEDERNLEGIIDELEANKNNAPDYDLATYDRFLSWLRSLKERYTWKPSDEQMECLSAAIEESNENSVLESLYQDLKKLREE